MTKSKFMQEVHYSINAETRKYHYFRGFRAALVVCVPIIAFLMVCVYILAMHA